MDARCGHAGPHRSARPRAAEVPLLEVGVQPVVPEALERPLVRPPGGGRAGEARPDDIREVLKVLHHLGVVERLVDEEPGARGIDGQALSRRGAMTQRGNDHGREDKTEPIHGWIPRAVLLRYAPSSCRVRSEKGGGGPAEPPRP